jgi:hypothetical protein
MRADAPSPSERSLPAHESVHVGAQNNDLSRPTVLAGEAEQPRQTDVTIVDKRSGARFTNSRLWRSGDSTPQRRRMSTPVGVSENHHFAQAHD